MPEIQEIELAEFRRNEYFIACFPVGGITADK